MNPSLASKVRQALRLLPALILTSLFVTGCSPFVKVGKPRKITVTLPCKETVKLEISVLKFDDCSLSGKGIGAGRTIRLIPADKTEFTLTANPLEITDGKTGSFDLTWTDADYKDGRLVLLLEDKAGKGAKGHFGLISLVVEPPPCGEASIRSQGGGSHIGTH